MRHPLVVAALVLWIGVIAGVSLRAFVHPRTNTVFRVYALASHNWWAGKSLYHERQLDEYLYSPVFAIAVTPFAYMPEDWAEMLWKLLGACTFAAALAAWLKYAQPLRLHPWEFAGVFLLVLGESIHSIADGNANLLTVAAVLLGITAVATLRTMRAGIWLSSATLIKVFPLVLIALLTVIYGFGLAIPFAAALAAGIALPMAISPRFGFAETRTWLSVLLLRTDTREVRHFSIEQLIRVYAHPVPTHWINIVSAAAGIAAAVLFRTYSQRHSRLDALAFGFALFAAWIVLFLPTMEPATAVVAAPSTALAIAEALRRNSLGWASALFVSWWLCGLGLTDILGSRARLFCEDHGALAIGGLLFAAYVVSKSWTMHTPGDLRYN